MKIRQMLLILLTGLLMVAAAAAQQMPIRLDRSEPITDFEAKYSSPPGSLTPEEIAAAEAKTKTEIAAKPTTTAAATDFAGRVNQTVADFLPFFQAGVDSITTSDDRRSVTLKLNPLDGLFGAVSLAATATQPEVFASLLEQIPEASREDQKKVIDDQLGDFEDVTASLTYGYQRQARGWDGTGFLFGRNYDIYRNLVSPMYDAEVERRLSPLVTLADTANRNFGRVVRTVNKLFLEAHAKSDAELKSLADRVTPIDPGLADAIAELPAGRWKKAGQVDDLSLEEVEVALTVQGLLAAEKGGSALDLTKVQTAKSNAGGLTHQLEEVMNQQADNSQARFAALDGELLPALATLINNQPQLTFTAAYRDPNKLVGPRSWVLTTRFEMGFHNFNSVLSEYSTLKGDDVGKRALDAYDAVAKVGKGRYRYEDKLVFTGSYKEIRDYDHRYSFTPEGGQTEDILLHLDGGHELNLRLLWNRSLPGVSQSMGLTTGEGTEDNALRDVLSFSLEYVDVTGDANQTDRFIGQLMYVVPLSASMTIPVTLTYANHSKFLDDKTDRLSAHVGLSYKINRDR
jgi:hypothetical protein